MQVVSAVPTVYVIVDVVCVLDGGLCANGRVGVGTR